MKRYLDLLMDDQRIEKPVPQWDALLSAELRRLLERQGVLDPAPDASLWPCDGGFTGCPMRVLATPSDAEHPYTASCGAGFQCHDVKLRAPDVQQLGTPFDRLATVLRRLFDVKGEAVTPLEIAPRAFRLGTIRRTNGIGETRDVVLAMAPAGASFGLLLQSLAAAARPSLLLVTSSDRVGPDLAVGHGSSDRVEIVFLDDQLVVRDDAIVLAKPRTNGTNAAIPNLPYARRLDGRGVDKALSEEEYLEALEEESSVDLFIDGLRLRRRADEPEGYVGSVRLPDGSREAFTMKAKEAAALFELVVRRTYCEPRQLRALAGIGHPERIVHRARRHFDREPYRFVLTRLGETTTAHSYAFAPEVGLSILVLVPGT